MLISEAYIEQNQLLHRSREDYGKIGCRFATQAMQLSVAHQTTDILDYGCGKGTLANHLPFPIKQYDPAIEKYAARPEPAQIVFCTDVLEHVEPEYLEAVLDDLQRVTLLIIVVAVALRPAKKTLPDGRNTHLIVQPAEWWLPKLMQRFQLINAQCAPEQELAFTGVHR